VWGGRLLVRWKARRVLTWQIMLLHLMSAGKQTLPQRSGAQSIVKTPHAHNGTLLLLLLYRYRRGTVNV
jgi:hypothetical protein